MYLQNVLVQIQPFHRHSFLATKVLKYLETERKGVGLAFLQKQFEKLAFDPESVFLRNICITVSIAVYFGGACTQCCFLSC